MALDPAHLVGTGGALGAVLRHLVGELVDVEGFPLGTATVNVVGTFVLGLVTFGGAGDGALLLVGVGACGSFTTFSSFSVDTVWLWERGERRKAAANAVGTLLAAAAALALSWLLVGT
jgi:CrcB protein